MYIRLFLLLFYKPNAFFCVHICTTLCALSGLCIRIRILRVKRLMRKCTVCAFKWLLHMNTYFARRVDFLKILGESFNVAMMLFNSFDLAMTSGMYVIRFVRRSNDRRGGCYPIRPTYQ